MRNRSQSPFAELGRLFRGPRAVWNIWALVWTIFFLAIAVLAAVTLFQVDGTRDQILFGVIFLFAIQVVTMLKHWFWNQMDRNAILDAIESLKQR